MSTGDSGGLVGGDALGTAESGNGVRDFARDDFEDGEASPGVVESRRMRPGRSFGEFEQPPSTQNERCLPNTFFTDLNACFVLPLPLELSMPTSLAAASLAAVASASPGLRALACPRAAEVGAS